MNLRDDQAMRRVLDRLAELREAGTIGPEEELELIRHYHATRASLASALGRLLPEYHRRRAVEGDQRALDWLSQAGEDVGRREGQAARQVLERLGLDRAVAS